MAHTSMPVACVGILLWVVFTSATRLEASNPCVSGPVTQSAVSALGDSPATGALTIGSLNIAGQPHIADAVVRWTHQRTLDILLLQEVGHRALDGAVFGSALSERLGFHFAYAPANQLGDTQTKGLAIVSRYPLSNVRVYPLTYHHLRFRSTCRIALEASVMTTAGQFRVVNVHLDTRINSGRRAAQLMPVLDALGDVDSPQIVGGDFNTMNVAWFRTMWPFPYMQRQSATVRELLASHGFQTPFGGSAPTFRFLGIPLKLDWLFLKQLDPIDWSVDRVPLTDHRGIWAQMKPRP